MLEFLERWKDRMWNFLLAIGVIFATVAILGGVLFDLQGSTVFAWFVTILAIFFFVFLIVSVVAFIIWIFFERPLICVAFIVAVVTLIVAVFLFITPLTTPIFNLGEILEPMFEFFNAK